MPLMYSLKPRVYMSVYSFFIVLRLFGFFHADSCLNTLDKDPGLKTPQWEKITY